MSAERKTTAAGVESAAEAAAALAEEVKSGPDVMSYTHTFKEPFEYRGRTITELTFNWGGLTGEDHQAIEEDIVSAVEKTQFAFFHPVGPWPTGRTKCAYAAYEV